jgi:tetratricopeptide (TPR) repeat protein
MMNAYNQVSIDLKESLADVNTQMTEALAEANKNYSEAMAEAEKNRTEKMADANKALAETLASAKEAYDEALAEASKALKEAREKAQKDLDEGLAEAQKTLQEALLKAQKDYEKSIDEINKATEGKLADLKDKLKEIAAAMEAISKGSSAGVLDNAPVFAKKGSIIPGIGYDPARAGMTANPYATGSTTNITQNFTATSVDPADVYTAVVGATKYGNAITIGNRRPNTIAGALEK